MIKARHAFSVRSVYFIFAMMISMASVSNADEISVTINGKTFSCGEGAGDLTAYGCECGRSRYSSSWILHYYSVNRSNGVKKYIKELNTFPNGKDSCEAAIQIEALCRFR